MSDSNLPSLRMGVCGVGALGQHHARILSTLPGVQLAGVHDADPARAAEIAAKHGVHAFASLEDLERIYRAMTAPPAAD